MKSFKFFIISIFSLCVYGFSDIPVKISAASAVLINADTGKVLYNKNGDTPRYPASITKIATAMYALEKKGDHLDDLVLVDKDSLLKVDAKLRQNPSSGIPPYRLEPDGHCIGLRSGQKISFRTLLYGMMVPSGNDAANVIAAYTSGSISQFMSELNDYLKSKGFNRTNFLNPHGLHCDGHITTALEMALIGREAMKNPYFRSIVGTAFYNSKELKTTLTNVNKLIKRGQFFYSKAYGIKTGYTGIGGYNLVAGAKSSDRNLIAVVMGCENDTQRYKDVITLFDYAFSEKKMSRKLLTKDFDTFSVTFKEAKAPLRACLHEDLSITYFPSEEARPQAFLCWEPVHFPIKIGDRVGRVELRQDSGEVIHVDPIYSINEVEARFFVGFINTLKLGFKLYHNEIVFGAMIQLVVLGVLFTIIKPKKKNPLRK